MVKIYYVPCYGDGTREYKLIKQGLVNNPRVELVDNKEESDFIFQFYYLSKHSQHFPHDLPPEKTVLIDYHDKSHWLSHVPCFVYFKRSWVEMVRQENYVTKQIIPRAPHLHPITMAIMDEFIIKEEMDRDLVLSCTLRRHRHRKKYAHNNRVRVLDLLHSMNIQGRKHIEEFNQGTMDRFNAPDMRDYFKLLRRSKIVVTCNPDKWEGDHRTWEAFASGALIFVDRMWTPMVHPLIDGEHCIFYDLSDEGLKILQERILYYLDRTDKAERIARAGHEFTMKYHRGLNRIDEILDVIT